MQKRICTISDLNIFNIPVLPSKVNHIKSGSTETFYERPFNFSFNTNGDGNWSSYKRKVDHNKICLSILDSYIFELRVLFLEKSWNVNQHGLIYTDSLWLKNLKNRLLSLGFDKNALDCIEYSEQGMQGDNYVSLDICHHHNNNVDLRLLFIKQFFDIFYIKKENEKILNSFAALEKIYFD